MQIKHLEECTTAGAVATVAQPFETVQKREPEKKLKGSNLLKGIKTSAKYANSLHEGEGFPHDVDHMPGQTIKHQNTNCTACSGRKSMYKLGGKLHADNKKGATKVVCPTCKGTGDKQSVKEETIHVGHRNSKGDWIKTSTHGNYADAKKAMQDLEKMGKKGVQHRYDNKGSIDPGGMTFADKLNTPDQGVAEGYGPDGKWTSGTDMRSMLRPTGNPEERLDRATQQIAKDIAKSNKQKRVPTTNQRKNGVAEGGEVAAMDKHRTEVDARRKAHLEKMLARSNDSRNIVRIKALLAKEFPQQGVAEATAPNPEADAIRENCQSCLSQSQLMADRMVIVLMSPSNHCASLRLTGLC